MLARNRQSKYALSLKGSHVTAQGNALGNDPRPKREALKGRYLRPGVMNCTHSSLFVNYGTPSILGAIIGWRGCRVTFVCGTQ